MHARGEPNPFEVALCAMCVLGGLPILINGPTPGSVQEALPELWVHLWGLLLVVSGGLVGGGHAMRRLGLEKLGLWPLFYGALVYAGVLLQRSPRTGFLLGLLLLGISAAALLRAAQVARRLGDKEPRMIRALRWVRRRWRRR